MSYLLPEYRCNFGRNLGLCGHPGNFLKPSTTFVFRDGVKTSPSMVSIGRTSHWGLDCNWLSVFRMGYNTVEVAKQLFVKFNDFVEVSVDRSTKVQ